MNLEQLNYLNNFIIQIKINKIKILQKNYKITMIKINNILVLINLYLTKIM